MDYRDIRFIPKRNAIEQLYFDKLGIVTPVVASGEPPVPPVEPDVLCFTAEEANSSVGMAHFGTNQTTTKPMIYLSYDATNWIIWDGTDIALANIGDKVYMYGYNPNGISSSENNYSSFTITGGRVAASGDVTNLLAFGGKTELTAFYCFFRLFNNCKFLTAPPKLPATTLAPNCYQYMFVNCSNLAQAPALPATILTYASQCYFGMFGNCTSLTTAPELPASKPGYGCYEYMFVGCTSLSSVKCLATDITATNCTLGWLDGVSASGTFTKSANMSGWPINANGIPSGWTVADA